MTLIKQGADGDCLYIVEKGSLQCWREDGGKETMVKVVGPGDVFGELALLYNAPRAATVKSVEECRLWRLDRDTFNAIVKDAATKKREMYDVFLSKNKRFLPTAATAAAAAATAAAATAAATVAAAATAARATVATAATVATVATVATAAAAVVALLLLLLVLTVAAAAATVAAAAATAAAATPPAATDAATPPPAAAAASLLLHAGASIGVDERV
ncbi:hypothetical protein ACSSS7_003332 [Eimeria intestinalis]